MIVGRACPPALRSLEVVLTSACNLQCSYCYQSERRSEFMRWEVLRASLDLLLRSEARELSLSFSGGEPLLALPLIERALEYLDATGDGTKISLAISTNGVLLDRRTVELLIAGRVRTQISFDGVAEAQQARAPGTFERLDRLLDGLRREQPEFLRDSCRVAMTVSSSNLRFLAQSFAYLVAKGVAEVGISPLFTHDLGWHLDLLDELAEQVAVITEISVDELRRSGRIPFLPFRSTPARERPDSGDVPMCHAPVVDKLVVDVDGTVTRCVVFAGSYQRLAPGLLSRCAGAARLGDIRAPDLDDRRAALPGALRATGAFHGKQGKYSGYRSCRSCRYLRQCLICPASIGHIPGNEDPDRVSDLQCAVNMAVLTGREMLNARAAVEGTESGPLGQDALTPPRRDSRDDSPPRPRRSRPRHGSRTGEV